VLDDRDPLAYNDSNCNGERVDKIMEWSLLNFYRPRRNNDGVGMNANDPLAYNNSNCNGERVDKWVQD